MALVRWNPWREMTTLQQQMNRLFDEALVPATGWERSRENLMDTSLRRKDW